MMEIADAAGRRVRVIFDASRYYSQEQCRKMREAGYKIKVDGKIWRA